MITSGTGLEVQVQVQVQVGSTGHQRPIFSKSFKSFKSCSINNVFFQIRFQIIQIIQVQVQVQLPGRGDPQKFQIIQIIQIMQHKQRFFSNQVSNHSNHCVIYEVFVTLRIQLGLGLGLGPELLI